MHRIERLLKPVNHNAGNALVTVDAPTPVIVKTATRDDKCLGAVLAPDNRATIVAQNDFEQITVVEIPAETEPNVPVRINAADIGGTRTQHIVIHTEESSKAIVILPHTGSAQVALNQIVGAGTGNSTNPTVVSLREWNDTVLHTLNQHLALDHDSKLTHVVVSFDGDLVRVCAGTDFRDLGAELSIFGVYFMNGGQHPEHRVFIDRSQPKCFSRVTCKDVLQGRDVHLVQIGDCPVREAADGVDTYEPNHNLAPTRGTRAGPVPNLRVENDEIEDAGHASVIDRFDDEQLFYLMSRGIPGYEARRLVVHGFFAELVSQIGVPKVVEHLMATVEAGLAKSRDN